MKKMKILQFATVALLLMSTTLFAGMVRADDNSSTNIGITCNGQPDAYGNTFGNCHSCCFDGCSLYAPIGSLETCTTAAELMCK